MAVTPVPCSGFEMKANGGRSEVEILERSQHGKVNAGAVLLELLRRRRMSQVQFAKISKVSSQNISKLTKTRKWGLNAVEKYSAILGVPARVFIEGLDVLDERAASQLDADNQAGWAAVLAAAQSLDDVTREIFRLTKQLDRDSRLQLLGIAKQLARG